MNPLDNENQLIDTHQCISSLIELGTVKVARMSQFLPTEERDALYEAVCKEQSEFISYNSSNLNVGVTKFLDLKSDTTNKEKAILTQKAHKALSKRVIEQLPSLFEMLDIKPFVVSDINLTLINCPDGHYGTPHRDSINGDYQISILYYFNRIPKVFCGGDLELFDNDYDLSREDNKEPIFTIDFEDNLLIAFASDTFHGVTKVQSDSDDFVDGRFIAAGFFGAE
ncbi:2OG-Fe(II) oxygenase [Dokdonia sp.]|uniref:2OG-Fe(II) oxygenase n=1 Tax=Dokdonia sp. TaxID=2024995 RepID=UPI003265B122